jgi:hypothetical protein
MHNHEMEKIERLGREALKSLSWGVSLWCR